MSSSRSQKSSQTVQDWFNREVMVVPEASVREYNFNVVNGPDHFSICEPRTKTSRSFYALKDFLIDIVGWDFTPVVQLEAQENFDRPGCYRFRGSAQSSTQVAVELVVV